MYCHLLVASFKRVSAETTGGTRAGREGVVLRTNIAVDALVAEAALPQVILQDVQHLGCMSTSVSARTATHDSGWLTHASGWLALV